MKLVPFIYFPGNAEEALNYYKEVWGGEIFTLTRYADSPLPIEGADRDKIIHGRLVFGDNTLLVSDDLNPGAAVRGNVEMFLEMQDPEKMKLVFNKLTEGGKVKIPIALQFWGAVFGLVEDKYGINWRFNYEVLPEA